MQSETILRSPAAPPPEIADRTSRDVLLWTFLAGCGILSAMAGPFLAGRICLFDDLGGFHLPVRAFYARQLAEHQAFDWMPSLYCGFYLTGEGQAGSYHPLHWLLYKCFPLTTAFGLECLLSYPLLWAGSWFFLNRRLRHHAEALFGGLIFTAASFNFLHFSHPNAVAIIAHLPWLLWCIDIVLTEGRRRRVLMATWGIALLTGSQILLGYPQYVWFSLLAETAYAGFLLYSLRRPAGIGAASRGKGCILSGRDIGAWPLAVTGIALGVLLGAIQWMPTLDALRHSARLSADSTFTNSNSLHPLNLLQLVAPYLFRQRVVGRFTHEFGLYIGAVPLLLVVWLWMQRNKLDRLKPLAVASGAFAALALLLAFGRYGLLYELQKYLPGVGSFQAPCRYLLLFQAGMMLIATMGFYLLLQRYRRVRLSRETMKLHHQEAEDYSPDEKTGKNACPPVRSGPLGLIVMLSIAAALGGLILHRNPLVASPFAVLAGAGLFYYAAWLITQVAAGNRGALVRLILFTAADLGVYGLSNSIYENTDLPADYIASIATPPGNQPGRILSCLRSFDDPGIRTGNQILLRGYQRADGYLGLEPKRQLDYHHLAALRVAGVRWVEKTPTTKNIQGISWGDDLWGEVPHPLPRARLVNKTLASADPQRDLDEIDIETTALTEIPLPLDQWRKKGTGPFCENVPVETNLPRNGLHPNPLRSPRSGRGEGTLASGALPSSAPSPFSMGTAEIREEQPERIVVQTECDQPRLLVLAESYHSGWKARSDGRQRRVYRVNGDFLGCLVGPGQETIVWEFQPESLRRGRGFSFLGFCLLPLAAVGLYRKPQKVS